MSNPIQKTVAFISYGDAVFRHGAIYSYLTAKHFDREAGKLRYLVYTDKPDEFVGLDIVIEEVNAEKLDAWAGNLDYIHRRTIAILKDALKKYGGSVALIDTDTYFRDSPQKLFDKIGPGQVCLHVFEACLKDCGSYTQNKLLDVVEHYRFVNSRGQHIKLSRNSPMWNAGVIGINIADVSMLDEVLCIIDDMWPKAKVSNLQQFVTGSLFSAHLHVSSASDVVFHYWEYSARMDFEARLPVILRALEHLPLSEKASRAYALRPRAHFTRNVKNSLRVLSRRVGLRFPGIIKNV